jgi:hypothetical protein
MEYAIAAIVLLLVSSVAASYFAGRRAGVNKAKRDALEGTEEARERYDEAKEDFHAGGGLAGAALDGVPDSDGDPSKVQD